MDLSSELQNVSQPTVAKQGPRMGAAQLFLTFLAQEKLNGSNGKQLQSSGHSRVVLSHLLDSTKSVHNVILQGCFKLCDKLIQVV